MWVEDKQERGCGFSGFVGLRKIEGKKTGVRGRKREKKLTLIGSESQSHGR